MGAFTNSPDVGVVEQKLLTFNGPVHKALSRALPNATAFITAYITAVYERFNHRYGYGNWENALYTPENMARYEEVLRQIKVQTDAHGVKLAFVFMPTRPDERFFRDKFAAIKTVLSKLEIPYADPLPPIVTALGKAPDGPLYPSLWANLGNAHPGIEISQFYASEANRFVENIGWLARRSHSAPSTPPSLCETADGSAVTVTASGYDYLGAHYTRLHGRVPDADIQDVSVEVAGIGMADDVHADRQDIAAEDSADALSAGVVLDRRAGHGDKRRRCGRRDRHGRIRHLPIGLN